MTFADQVEAEELEHRKGLEDALRRIHDLREAKRQIEKSLEEVELPVREHLRLNPEDVLMDDHGYTARLQSRRGRVAYDAAEAIQERNPVLYRRLAELQCLQVDDQRVRDAQRRGWLVPADVDPFRRELGGSAALIVEKSRDGAE